MAFSLVHGKIVQKAYHRGNVTKIMPRLNAAHNYRSSEVAGMRSVVIS